MGAFKGKYSSIETAHCLDMNRLVGAIKEGIGKNFPSDKAPDSEAMRKLIVGNLDKFTINTQKFEFTSIPNRLGGSRWMVMCPKCGKRVVKLYKPSEEDKEPRYLCKDCHMLRPPSALYGPTRRYKEMIRPLRRMERIKEILTGNNLSEIKTRELLDEYDELDKTVKTSTFYRKAKLLTTSEAVTSPKK